MARGLVRGTPGGQRQRRASTPAGRPASIAARVWSSSSSISSSAVELVLGVVDPRQRVEQRADRSPASPCRAAAGSCRRAAPARPVPSRSASARVDRRARAGSPPRRRTRRKPVETTKNAVATPTSTVAVSRRRRPAARRPARKPSTQATQRSATSRATSGRPRAPAPPRGASASTSSASASAYTQREQVVERRLVGEPRLDGAAERRLERREPRPRSGRRPRRATASPLRGLGAA